MYFRQFPILHAGMSIPWPMLAPFEEQARANHGGQTLARLAERGGLDAAEALNVLDGLRWHREGCWSSKPPSVCRQELIERVWKWEHENADGRLEALSRIVRRVLACGQLEKLEGARPYLLEEPAAPARPEASAEPDSCHHCGSGGRIDFRGNDGNWYCSPECRNAQRHSEPAGNTGLPCPGCGCSKARCDALKPPAIKCCPDCRHVIDPGTNEPPGNTGSRERPWLDPDAVNTEFERGKR